MRNPWAREVWDGAWSDTSSLWTTKLKKEVGFEKKDEGIFYMSIEDLYDRTEATYINYDTTNWTFGYFAMFDDPAKKNGFDLKCGYKCTRHTVKISSDYAQDVWIGVHTWDFYGYADDEKCPAMSGNDTNEKEEEKQSNPFAFLGLRSSNSDDAQHVLINQNTKEKFGWDEGTIWIPKQFINGGESIEIIIEFNWNKPEVTKDWSVTAWGETSDVRVTHNDGIKSDSLPYVPIGAP